MNKIIDVFGRNTIVNDMYLIPLIYLYKDEILDIEFSSLNIDFEQKYKTVKEFNWEYRNPWIYQELCSTFTVPNVIFDRLRNNKGELVNAKYVHKVEKDNVLVKQKVDFGKTYVFSLESNWKELNSDHQSDHVDGIIIFELIRQSVLASYHLNNLSFETIVALVDLKLNYLKYIEKEEELFIHIIPANNSDGGAMFAQFCLYQFNEIVAEGYLGTYAFKSTEKYFENTFSNRRL